MVSLVGRQFDHLLVLCRSPGRGTPQWVCRCSCGGTAIIEDNPLRMGGVTSCGCQNAPAPDYSEAIGQNTSDELMEEIKAWIAEMDEEERARVLEILYGMGEANEVERMERMIESRERMIARMKARVEAMKLELTELKRKQG